MEGTTTVKLSTRRRWSDVRLSFASFGPGKSSAIISPNESEALWVPWTVFANMKHGERWFRSDKLDEFSAKFAKGYNPSENVHLGRDIVIEYEREMVVDLMCEYDMFWFHFDSQTCGVELYQREEEITLIPKSVAYTGPRQLIQYTVVGIDMCPAVFEVNTG